MSQLDTYVERFHKPPFAHQKVGVELLLENEFFGLLDEQGMGKSAQIINAACILREEMIIDLVLIVTLAAGRSVWTHPDPDIGQIKAHSWLPSRVMEFHNPNRLIWSDASPELDWVVTNYEFVRNKEHRDKLIESLEDRNVFMCTDESSFIKSRGAAQTKACIAIGKHMARRAILNGTPTGNNGPLDMWSQMLFLSPTILPYKNFYHFRSEYAVMGGFHNHKVIQWKNLERFQALIAPHVIRREKKDCLDLPPKIGGINNEVTGPVIREVALTESTWTIYKQMRDDAVVWMNENPSMAAQAGVKALRLIQITGGFLGGFPVDDPGEEQAPQEIGREKLDFLRSEVALWIAENPTVKIIVWCRYRAEIERVAKDLVDLLPTYKLYGQKKGERSESIERFSKTDNPLPALLAGQVQAGGFALNLIAASRVAYYSNHASLIYRMQSEERVHRPGQINTILIEDILATGPANQKTIDHKVFKSLREHNDMANWTVSSWKRALLDE